MHRAVSQLYGPSDDETFESHLIRMKWLFGVSCLVRSVLNVLKHWYPALQDNDIIFIGSMCIVEVVPLAAALLSMAIVERRMNSIEAKYSSTRFIDMQDSSTRFIER